MLMMKQNIEMLVEIKKLNAEINKIQNNLYKSLEETTTPQKQSTESEQWSVSELKLLYQQLQFQKWDNYGQISSYIQTKSQNSVQKRIAALVSLIRSVREYSLQSNFEIMTDQKIRESLKVFDIPNELINVILQKFALK
ncbi:Homeobox-like_domain superfamily [Hexamita inflata]|uniref:Homeobox-like domain superfamily n=1 Tax=Hexamita inflata TaxID=28002 RepID=A0AA86P9W0_9EUKA|nr:Homeobox-like domain superfamily [Hexamita inflata]CAI9971124.1 Homeobox-like domain superfamily [Hexamita inflata]